MSRTPADDALRQRDVFFRVLTETAEDHIFVITSDDRVEYVNAAAARQYGALPEQLIGRLRSEIFPPDVAERQGRNLQQVFATGKPLYVEGRTLYREREVWLGTWLNPVPDDNGGVRAVLGVSRDMTDRKRLEAELASAQKLEAIGRLAGGIAHDFNNNLTAILGYVEMLSEQLGDDTPAARELKEVRRAAERASGLVRRLLAFGRRQVLQPRSLDLHTVISELRPLLERLLGEHIRVDVRLAAALPTVTGDASELEQVVMNVALNARDAMPQGGTLTVETSNVTVPAGRIQTMAAGTYVLIRIDDTGTGMTPSVKEHVFEPFFTTKGPAEGSGLGLSTVYGIVKQLNGFIEVESEVGRGSAFRVYLPATTAEAVHEPVATAPASPPLAAHRQTILLVEDEDTVRRFATLALERHGFRVIAAATPEEAQSRAARDEPLSLLLTDVVMPRMSGPELADRLKQTRPDLPVLYMSGYPSNLVLPDGLLAASTRLLSKPFTIVQLVAAVQEALAGQR